MSAFGREADIRLDHLRRCDTIGLKALEEYDVQVAANFAGIGVYRGFRVSPDICTEEAIVPGTLREAMRNVELRQKHVPSNLHVEVHSTAQREEIASGLALAVFEHYQFTVADVSLTPPNVRLRG